MQLHQKKRSQESLSDEYETPTELYKSLCDKFGFYPTLDVSSNGFNSKCPSYASLKIDDYLNSRFDGENCEWNEKNWCNPPHSRNEQFVRKARKEFSNGNETMMILPVNTMSSKYWHECIEGIAEYYPIQGRIKFLVDGKPSKFPSRNAYCVVIWRKK